VSIHGADDRGTYDRYAMNQPRRQKLAQRREQARDRFGLLLVLLVGSFVALGFADQPWARVVAGTLQLAALVVGFLSTGLARDYPWLGLVAVVGIAALVLAAGSADEPNAWAEIGSIAVLLVIGFGVLRRVLRHTHVTMQTLYGAMCAYFLIGLIFGSLYGAMNDFSTDSIFGVPVDWSVYSYFSFTTLTTVGYGDYTLQTDLARRIAMIEAVGGQLFIATTLARLVSLYRSGNEG
jgi:hypothetical protein